MATTSTNSSEPSALSGSAIKPNDPSRNGCLFCRICDEHEKESTKLIYQDDTIAVFPDIRPKAKYHFLVVPKQHIKDSKSLNGSQAHKDLLERLVQAGTKVLNDSVEAEAEVFNNSGNEVAEPDGSVDDKSAISKSSIASNSLKVLMGFHWPPFHTVSHLHLHVISPSDSMGFIGRWMFRPNSYWFVSPEWVRERMEKLQLEQEGRS